MELQFSCLLLTGSSPRPNLSHFLVLVILLIVKTDLQMHCEPSLLISMTSMCLLREREAEDK